MSTHQINQSFASIPLLDALRLYREYADAIGTVPVELATRVLSLGDHGPTVLKRMGAVIIRFDNSLWVSHESLTVALKAKTEDVAEAAKSMRIPHQRSEELLPGWQDEEWWRVCHVRKWASCSRRHIERAVGAGLLSKFKRDQCIVFRSDEVKAWATPKSAPAAPSLAGVT